MLEILKYLFREDKQCVVNNRVAFDAYIVWYKLSEIRIHA